MAKKLLPVCIAALCSIFFFSCNSRNSQIKELSSVDTNNVQLFLGWLNGKISEDPDEDYWLYRRAGLWMRTGAVQKAIQDMEKAVSMNDDALDYQIRLADAYFMVAQTRKTKEILAKILEKDDKNLETNMKLAELYFYAQQYQQSINHLDKVLSKDIYNPKGYFMKGMCFKETGDTLKAVSNFQTATEQDPEYFDAYVQLGILYLARQNAFAEQYLTTALSLRPKSIDALYARGMYRQEKGDTAGAFSDYRTILKFEPCNSNALYNQGFIWYTSFNDSKKALNYFDKAFLCDTTYLEALQMRATCYKNLGNSRQAQSDMARALRIKAKAEGMEE